LLRDVMFFGEKRNILGGYGNERKVTEASINIMIITATILI